MSTPRKFRKRPVVIDAMQWTGDNGMDLHDFAGAKFDVPDDPDPGDPEATAVVFDSLHSTWVLVYTGDWIIRSAEGRFYPCRDAAFRETYEPAEGTS